MNKGRLLMVVFAMMIALPCFAKKKVVFNGHWQKAERSVFDKLPIEAWVEDDNNELLLEFSKNLGTVQVTVTNSAGQTVYSQTVETGNTPTWIVTLGEVQNTGMVVSVSDGQNIVSGKL